MRASATRAYWDQLVTCAVLGADRRDPPPPPVGPFADLAADDPQASAAERLAQQVAAVAAASRAGMTPSPRESSAARPDADDRPVTPPGASVRWRAIVSRWPVLEDEWLVVVLVNGWRLSPELVPPLMRRHRTHALRAARVLAAAGPLARWLVDQMPELAPSGAARARVDVGALISLPPLPVPPELAALVDADPEGRADDAAVAALCEPIRHGRVPPAHLRALANVVARMPIGAVAAVAAALGSHPLGDLATLRLAMIDDLIPPIDAEDP